MKKKNNLLLPYNIQFFADVDSSQDDDSNNVDDSTKNDNNEGDNKNQEEKKFTQKQVNAMMAREKREGRKSVLKELGFNDEEEAKKGFALLSALLDSQKTEDEKNNTVNKKLQSDKEEAERRAELAEAKIICLSNGVDKDNVDDVIAIATLKVVDGEKTLEDVIKEMKKNKVYSSFFHVSDEGTGGTPGHSGNSGTNEGIGKRLASSTKIENKKSSFFD